jgi:hypothetical protein
VKAYTFLLGKSERMRPLSRLKSRCKYNIKILLRKVGFKSVR